MAQATRFWWRLSDRHALERMTGGSWRTTGARPAAKARNSPPLTHFGGLTPDHAAYPETGQGPVPSRRRFVLGLCTLLLLAVSSLLLAGTGRGRSFAPGFLVSGFNALQLSLGFEIRQVTIDGHRSTGDREILEAAGLGDRTASLTYDAEAARARIRRLPWIDTVRLALTLPDVLEIAVTERAPFAVWEDGSGRSNLIDVTGRVLGPIGLGLEVMLPVVAGAGAPDGTARLFEMLARHPAIMHRLTKAERVGGRRWSLHLSGGSVALLPADEAAAAVARLGTILKESDHLPPEARIIDLRLETTVIERRRDARILPATGTIPTPAAAATPPAPDRKE